MKFITAYCLQPSAQIETLKRFAETQGPPPAGVTMLGRWTSVASDRGFVLAETADAKALYAWVLDWADLLSFEVIPVLDDAEVMEVLTKRSH